LEEGIETDPYLDRNHRGRFAGDTATFTRALGPVIRVLRLVLIVTAAAGTAGQKPPSLVV
jgi:hypothetical protein